MFWFKVVLIIIVAGLTNAHDCYKVYQPTNHENNWEYNNCIQRGPPICKQWCITYVMVGFCEQPRYTCCNYREKPGYCPILPPRCMWTFPYFTTKGYECTHDYNCPMGYKCCQDPCFVHKICKPCINYPSHSKPTTIPTTRDTEETTIKFSTTPSLWWPTIPAEPTTITSEQTTGDITTDLSTDTRPSTTESETTESIETAETIKTTETTESIETTETTKTTETTVTSTEISISTETEQTTSQSLTTDVEIEGSGIGGSGDFEIPEPEAARRFFEPNDDEDFNFPNQ